MLAAVPFFNDFARERGLQYKALLLTEGYMVDGQKEDVQYIQYGAAGKIMPMFFCVGKMTHGEEPLLGLDANLLTTEVYRQMALNPEFCQQNRGITTAQPACLKLQDMKENYSLSTALYAACYFNIATIQLNPEEMMEKLVHVAEKAFQEALDLIKQRVSQFERLTGKQPEHYEAKPCVMTFRQLYMEVKKSFDGDLVQHLRTYGKELTKKNPELQDTAMKLVKHLYELYDEKRPMIVVSIIPPYYPDVNIEREDADTAKMLSCIDSLITYAKETYGRTLETSEYYGISDLCYTWLAQGMDFDKIFDNLVGAGEFYQFPTEEMKAFRVPALVLGCKGKDMHKFTERLEKSYNFDVLPDLYIKLIDELLK
jgi:arginine utilization protein RocB